jgi:type IV pilus assembly protein PilW
MRLPRRARGFTLIEMLVSTAVAATVLMAISLTFVSQAQQYRTHSSRRSIQANSRQALAFMERQLRLAGYGVDPDRAIVPYDSFDAASNLPAAGFPDGIAIHTRDPVFRRTALTVSSAEITLATALTEPMRMGQILLVICGGARTYAYVTVGVRANVGDTRIRLDGGLPAVDSPAGAPRSLFHQQGLLAGGPGNECFTNEPPTVVRIERAAFYVASFDYDGRAATPQRTPYLMLHQGLDLNDDGAINAADAVPVAEGIEQLQISYVLNTRDNAPPILVGVENAPPWWGENWAISAPVRPVYSDPYDADSRVASHPANIRQVRLTLVSRSATEEPEGLGDNARDPLKGDGVVLSTGQRSWAQLENLTAPSPQFNPAGGGFYRQVLRTSVSPKNLLSRSQFLPVTRGGG